MLDTIKGGFVVKKYYVLIFVIVVVVGMFSSELGTKIEAQSPTIQGLAMLAFIVPICLLLHIIGKDENIKSTFRIAAKIGVVFILLCYIGGLIAEFM